MITVTKEYRAEIAHRLPDHSGKCKLIHGHSYIFQVTASSALVSGDDLPRSGMVFDFSHLKGVLEEVIGPWDHSLLLFEDDPLCEDLEDLEGINLIKFPYIPTAENMAKFLAMRLKSWMKTSSCVLESVKVWETATSCSEWRRA